MQFKSMTEILADLKVSGNSAFGKTTTPSEAVDVDGNIAVTGTVDGVDISVFKSDYDVHTHTEADITDLGDYLPLTGGSLTGGITVVKSSAFDFFKMDRTADANIVGTWNLFPSYTGGFQTARLNYNDGTERTVFEARIDATTYVTDLFAGTVGSGRKVWHAENDGPGSGLDADTVDGSHASAFALSSHTHTESDITDLKLYVEGSLNRRQNPDTTTTGYVGWTNTADSGNPTGTSYGFLHIPFTNDHAIQLAGRGTADIYWRAKEAGTWQIWKKMWHEGNLDPDTIEPSYDPFEITYNAATNSLDFNYTG